MQNTNMINQRNMRELLYVKPSNQSKIGSFVPAAEDNIENNKGQSARCSGHCASGYCMGGI